MKLIKRLPQKIINGKIIKYGIFLCPIDDKEVEREIRNGLRQKSCGCRKYKKADENHKYKHGGKGTKLYNVWTSIKTRCNNPNSQAYKNYGGRGITICDEWLAFIPFRDWALNNGYVEGLEIDRIENDKGYSPENCHFVTNTENQRNRRNNVLNLEKANEIRGLSTMDNYTQQKLANKYNVSQKTISDIINNKTWNNI